MFVAISKYQKPLNEVDVHHEAHVKFLKDLIAQEKLLICGRQNPPEGGVIIGNFKSREEFESILAEDPFIVEGCAEYKITEFNPGLYQEIFARFVEKNNPF